VALPPRRRRLRLRQAQLHRRRQPRSRRRDGRRRRVLLDRQAQRHLETLEASIRRAAALADESTQAVEGTIEELSAEKSAQPVKSAQSASSKDGTSPGSGDSARRKSSRDSSLHYQLSSSSNTSTQSQSSTRLRAPLDRHEMPHPGQLRSVHSMFSKEVWRTEAGLSGSRSGIPHPREWKSVMAPPILAISGVKTGRRSASLLRAWKWTNRSGAWRECLPRTLVRTAVRTGGVETGTRTSNPRCPHSAQCASGGAAFMSGHPARSRRPAHSASCRPTEITGVHPGQNGVETPRKEEARGKRSSPRVASLLSSRQRLVHQARLITPLRLRPAIRAAPTQVVQQQ
jgi:hypothetical protein